MSLKEGNSQPELQLKVFLKSMLRGCEIFPVNLRFLVDQFATEHHGTDILIIAQLMKSVEGHWLVRCYV